MSSTRFIGRAEPIALFDDVLTDVLVDTGVDHGDMLLVGGEAGVGKSRLVDELADRARVAGAVVLRGWCVEHGDDTMPLAPISDLLRDAVAHGKRLELDDIVVPAVELLSRLLPEFGHDERQRRAESPLSMVALSDGVLRALRGLSEHRPVVIVVEDLQWSDASTRQLLMFLAPRVARHRVVLIATYRTDELHRRHPLRSFLVALRRAVRPEQVELLPFTADELADLVADITGTAPDPRVVRALHHRCAGNAFLAEELVAGEVFGRPSAVLRDAVLSRTDPLDDEAMTVLRLAAAAGPGVGAPVLAGASGLSSQRLESALDAIVAAGLCVRDADRIRFRHELAREVVEDEILTGDRSDVHAALASTLQSLTPHRVGEIARHWMVAGNQPAALAASVAAGRAAVDVAADAEALTQFERALELWDRVPDAALAGCDHADLLLDAADAAGRARFFDRAVALGRQAVAETAHDKPASEGAACLRLVPWAWFSFEDVDLRALIERSTAGIADGPPGGRQALALAWQALLDVAASGYTRAGARAARPIAQRAVDLARAGASAQAEVHALITLGVCTSIDGDPAGLDEIRMALEKARAGGFSAEAGRAYDSLAVYLSEFGRDDEVIDLEPEAFDYCTAAGIHRVHGVMVQLRVIRALHRRGHWQAVEQRVERLRAEFGTLTIEHLTLVDSWGLILVRQGRLDGVREMVDDTFARLGDHLSVIGPATVTAIELQAALGLVAPIPGLVESALERILPDLPREAAAVVAAAIGALADLAVGAASDAKGRDDPSTHRSRADAWLHRVRTAKPPDVPPWIVIADAERSRLNNEPSESRWTAAVDAWRDLHWPYESAYTQWRLAQAMLMGSNRQSAAARARARTLLVEARQAAARLGADPLTDRIDTLAARAHLSIAPPRDPETADGRAKDEVTGLTDREREVLRLVAEGYSNGQIGQALFISRKTASVHVSNILRKLGVSSRLEAATQWVNPRR